LIEGGVELRVANRDRKSFELKTECPHIGVAPYGFCIIQGRLVPVPKEQVTVQLVLKLRTEGKTLMDIAEHLNRHRVKPRIAKKWDHSTVRSILKRHQIHSNKTKKGESK